MRINNILFTEKEIANAPKRKENKMKLTKITKESTMSLDTKRVFDVEVEDVNTNDYPDFSDAYISYAVYKEDDGSFRELTDSEYDELNDDGDFVYDAVENYLY